MSILPCSLPYGKAGGLQILCCQEINVSDYNFNLDALALKPSDFCNVREFSLLSVTIIEACLPGGKVYFDISISLTGEQSVYY